MIPVKKQAMKIQDGEAGCSCTFSPAKAGIWDCTPINAIKCLVLGCQCSNWPIAPISCLVTAMTQNWDLMDNTDHDGKPKDHCL